MDVTLEERIEAQKNRLRESLRGPRAEAAQRAGHFLYDLRMAHTFQSIQDFEGRVLSLLIEVRRKIEEVENIRDGYTRTLAEREREAAKLKAELEGLDSLAVNRQRILERYHFTVADVDVYREAAEAIQASITELERGLRQIVGSMATDFTRYVDEKCMAMATEAERVCKEAEGKMRYAQQLQQRAQTFASAFRQKYELQEDV
jgi:hypothetical protein